jgi:hypothetical protein
MDPHDLRRTALGLRRIANGLRTRVGEKRGERFLCHDPVRQKQLDWGIGQGERAILRLEEEAAELERKAKAFEFQEEQRRRQQQMP